MIASRGENERKAVYRQYVLSGSASPEVSGGASGMISNAKLLILY